MAFLNKIAGFVLHQALGDVGGKAAAWIEKQYTDPSQALPNALEQANAQTWRVIELALAGDSIWDRFKGKIVSGTERGVLEPLKAWVKTQGDEFRLTCLEELQAARKAGVLATGKQELVTAVSGFSRIANSSAVLDQSQALVIEMGQELRRDYPALARLFTDITAKSGGFLISAFSYFFRQAVISQPALKDALQFEMLSQVWQAEKQGWQALGQFLTEQGAALAAELERLGNEQAEMKSMLREVLERLPQSARRGGISPRLSSVLKSVSDLKLFEEMERRLNSLPPESRTPEMLDAVGRLAMGVGLFEKAEQRFQQAAESAGQKGVISAQAEAHYNTYRALLEQRQFDKALAELIKAAQLDPINFSPFPLDKYEPKKILGAGGFGVAFLCYRVYLDDVVVLKNFYTEDLERDITVIFREGQLLNRIRDENIIKILDSDYAASGKQHPYLVMEYFNGTSLANYLKEKGVLTLAQTLGLAYKMAHALKAAHDQGVLHRDIKPDNLLVRFENNVWTIKLIDFGLAAANKAVRETMAAGSAHSLAGESLGGTFQFSAPEQLGLCLGKVGPWSDIYAFGKTLSYALFLNTQPNKKNYRLLGDHPFSDLLSDCLEQSPGDRPQHFGVVLDVLKECKSTGEILEIKSVPNVERIEVVPEIKRTPKIFIPESIHGWPTNKVQALQKEVAESRGLSVVSQGSPLSKGNVKIIPPEMVLIPPGIFLMGSPGNEKERRECCERQHEVTIPKPFLLGRYAVTRGEFEVFIKMTGYQIEGEKDGGIYAWDGSEWKKDPNRNWREPGFKQTDRHPVVGVSWNDAVAYCEWLSKETEKSYRLPTEAEWEYACRAGTTTPFYFGETINTDQVNYDGNYTYGNGTKGLYRQKTVAVGHLPPNPFGVYEMHGNVWEWTCSEYDDSYGGSEECKNRANNSDVRRSLRGGAWFNLPNRVRSAYRGRSAPGYRGSDSGFRLSQDLL